MRLSFWEAELADHQDREFASWVCKGIEQGFHIGFSDKNTVLHPSRFNMLSTTDHPQVIREYIAKELGAHHLLEVNQGSHNVKNIQISPLGVIPKKGRPNCWRLIMDLSAPQGHSVNDGIDKELYSLHYTSLDEAAIKVCQLGKGTLLAKMDIRQAYRNIPVAPEDKPLLGMKWEGHTYIDQVLPFGLRSAPMIFSAIVDALLWVMKKKGVSWAIHYIDGFLTIEAPGKEECMQNTLLMQSICEDAGLPMEPSKSVGLTTEIVFLGILIDSIRGELRLPPEKLTQLQDTISQWRGKRPAKKGTYYP